MNFLTSSIIKYAFFQIPGMRVLVTGARFFLIICVFLYILLGAGLYAMAKRRQMPWAFLAWIPAVGQGYVLGALADEAAGGRMYRVALTVLSAASIVLGALMFPAEQSASAPLLWTAIGLLVVYAVFWFKALFWVYAQYMKAPRTLLVLSIIFFFVGPIVIFIRRGANPRPLDARSLVQKKGRQ